VASYDEELDRLFALPLDEFVGGRNELAKRLKDAEIRALPKPTVSAWTINQLSRVDRPGVEALLDAGAELRSVQSRLLGGDDAGDLLRKATLRERDAVAHLRKRAQTVLAEAGRAATAATLERLATTLRAAAVTEEGRELLACGRLTVDLEPPGFDAVEAAGAARSRTPSRKTDELAERRRRREQERRRKELEDKAQAAERAAREAERDAEEAERAATKARRIADKARAEAAALRAKLDDAS
jgi:predicted ribosome quality control (RQC) complex YloA/Tae2 family protein